MKRHAIHGPMILGIFLTLLAIGLLQAATPTPASAQDGVEPPEGVSGPAAAASDKAPGPPEYVPEQLLVRFRGNFPPGQAARAMADEGAVPLKHLPALDVYVLRVPPGLTVEKAVEVFSHRFDVEYAEPNYILRVVDTLHTWSGMQWAPQKIQAPQAWAQLSNPAPVTIAIVDSGVDYGHSQLAPNVLAGQGYDFYNNDDDPMDDHGHGTHVAGIAAATVGASVDSMAGVCPFCQLLAVKVLGADGSGSLDVVASGITYAADHGANVINLSLGATVGAATLQNAVDYAWGKGAVVVAAAGNDGANIPLYPAAYSNAMAVAATDRDDNHSCFSSYGTATTPYVAVAAPGEAIYSTIPRVDGQDAYAVWSGTSMATPHVSGLAGLLFAQDSGRTNTDVRELIKTTTEDLGPLGSDPFFGSGRINAYRAVTDDTSPTTPPSRPDRVFSDQATVSGYAHARKLARDAGGVLHMVWHTADGGYYRVRYAFSADNGATWVQSDIYSSGFETYHPAIAIGPTDVYVVFPSRPSVSAPYQILFTSKPLGGGAWAAPTPLIADTYQAVRPDIFYDAINGRLHVVAASLDDAPYVYHRSFDPSSGNWSPVHSVNPSTSTTASNTRYATVYANGPNVYIAARTLARSFFTTYYLHTVRSEDGGETWFDPYKVSSYLAWFSGEYGVSLAGVGDRLYMGYEAGGGLYFRTWLTTEQALCKSDHPQLPCWSDWLQLETAGAWPSITQASDGQAWLMWENAGSLLMRHYDGSTWEPATTLLTGTSFDKGTYPNLKLRPDTGQVEWVSTSCRGGPFSVVYGSLPLSSQPPSITAQPTDQTACEGASVTFSAGAAGSPAPTAQWQVSTDGGANWSDVPNATSPAYTFTAVAGDHGKQYRAVFTNTEGSATSNAATLTVNTAPFVTANPTSQAVNAGQLVTFTAAASGSPTPTAQWQTYTASVPTWTNISGATSTSLTFVTSAGDDGSNYRVEFTNACGQATTNAAILTVNQVPVVTTQPADQTVNPGQLASFSAAASGNPAPAVRWQLNSGSGWTDIDGATSTTYSFTAQASDDGRQYRAVFTNVAGTATSNAATLTVNQPPAAPSGLTATAVSASQINLAWTDLADNETGFKVERSPDGSTWTEIATVSADVTTYLNTGLTASTTYFYRVRAHNNAGDSGYSNTASATTPAAPSLPLAPSGLTAKAISRSQINLAWTDNSNNETGFEIERRKCTSSKCTSFDSFVRIAVVGASVRTYSDTGLNANTTYQYRVRAYNAVGNSNYSNVAKATTRR